MPIRLPHNAIALLVGAPAAGKSTFAARHFRPDQVLSSDRCREMVCGDAASQAATPAAFALLETWLEGRAKHNQLTVIDALNVDTFAREAILKIARAHNRPTFAFVFNTSREQCQRLAAKRSRLVPPDAVDRQYAAFEGARLALPHEGFTGIHLADAASTRLEIEPAPRTAHATGWDIVGDVHGCRRELRALLAESGYVMESDESGAIARVSHPNGRKLAFLGDLVDKGPDSVGVLRDVMALVKADMAEAVVGNHDNKLARALGAHRDKLTLGTDLVGTIRQIEAEVDPVEQNAMREFLVGLPYSAILVTPDAPPCYIAHAGLEPDAIDRQDKTTQSRCLYGRQTGVMTALGPERDHLWADAYADPAGPFVAYGHTPVLDAECVGNSVNLDTGCVYGGHLSAMQYPERRVTRVAALAPYAESRVLPTIHALRDESRASQAAAEQAALDAALARGAAALPSRPVPSVPPPAVIRQAARRGSPV